MIWHIQKHRDQAALEEAIASRQRAELALERTRAETPKYQALAEALRQLRQRNNFAATIETSFRGGKT
jgi:hypothetical protein